MIPGEQFSLPRPSVDQLKNFCFVVQTHAQLTTTILSIFELEGDGTHVGNAEKYQVIKSPNKFGLRTVIILN